MSIIIIIIINVPCQHKYGYIRDEDSLVIVLITMNYHYVMSTADHSALWYLLGFMLLEIISKCDSCVLYCRLRFLIVLIFIMRKAAQ